MIESDVPWIAGDHRRLVDQRIVDRPGYALPDHVVFHPVPVATTPRLMPPAAG